MPKARNLGMTMTEHVLVTESSSTSNRQRENPEDDRGACRKEDLCRSLHHPARRSEKPCNFQMELERESHKGRPGPSPHAAPRHREATEPCLRQALRKGKTAKQNKTKRDRPAKNDQLAFSET